MNSSFTPLVFGAVNLVQMGLHAIENFYPSAIPSLSQNISKNPNIAVSKFAKDNELAKINEIKKRVCHQVNLDPSTVQFKVKASGKMLAHGGPSKSVLIINSEIVRFLNNPHPACAYDDEGLDRLRYRDYLQDLPNDPESLRNIICRISRSEKIKLAHYSLNFFLDLTEAEIEFILRHELAGHICSNDTLKLGIFSTVFNSLAFGAAEVMHYMTPESYASRFVWHSIFYGMSCYCLQSVINKRCEHAADTKALDCKTLDAPSQLRNDLKASIVKGGALFFKRLYILELLEPLLERRASRFSRISELANYYHKLGEEPIEDRLRRCYEMKGTEGTKGT